MDDDLTFCAVICETKAVSSRGESPGPPGLQVCSIVQNVCHLGHWLWHWGHTPADPFAAESVTSEVFLKQRQWRRCLVLLDSGTRWSKSAEHSVSHFYLHHGPTAVRPGCLEPQQPEGKSKRCISIFLWFKKHFPEGVQGILKSKSNCGDDCSTESVSVGIVQNIKNSNMHESE